MSDQQTDGQLAERVRKAMVDLEAAVEAARAAGLSVTIYHPTLDGGMSRYYREMGEKQALVEVTRNIKIKL